MTINTAILWAEFNPIQSKTLKLSKLNLHLKQSFLEF